MPINQKFLIMKSHENLQKTFLEITIMLEGLPHVRFVEMFYVFYSAKWLRAALFKSVQIAIFGNHNIDRKLYKCAVFSNSKLYMCAIFYR